MKITKVVGREIYDSRGWPTIECELVLDNEITVLGSVPTGASVGHYEAHDLRDEGQRLQGKGVLKAIENLETVIAPVIIGKEPDVIGTDLKMLELDGTEDKSNLGANTMLAVSIAMCKAQALTTQMDVYEFLAYLCELETVTLPFPMFNIINGGKHAHNKLTFQEIMIVPIGAPSFRKSMEIAETIFYSLGNVLTKRKKSLVIGDEGGYAGDFKNEKEALDLLTEAIEKAGIDQEDVVFALDVAASQFYNAKTKKYAWKGENITSADMIELYEQLSQMYPIYSIEDGLSDQDIKGWKKLTSSLGDSLQLVGDDLFATSAGRVVQGIEENWANSVIIKPNQAGTVTETLQAIKLCKSNDINIVVSHRSGETEDTFIVDLAVGTSAGQIKAGGCCRGERMAKYNQLLRIEDELTLAMLGI